MPGNKMITMVLFLHEGKYLHLTPLILKRVVSRTNLQVVLFDTILWLFFRRLFNNDGWVL